MNDETWWSWQMSWKVGPHMLNHRTTEFEELLQGMQKVSDNASEIAAHANAFEALKPPVTAVTLPLGTTNAPAATAPAPAPVRPAQPNVAQNQTAAEHGPLVILKVDQQDGMTQEVRDPATGDVIKPSRPYSRFTVATASFKAATFDSLMGDAAKRLLGKQAYLTVKKGRYGYDLEGIRSA